MSLWFRLAGEFGASRVCGVLVLVCVGALGCAVADDARLLTLTGVESGEVVLGDSLVVRGEGFPTGAACTVTLRGELAQAGVSSRSIDVALAGRAISGDAVAANLTASAFPVIDAHATFHGHVSLSFSAAAGASHVSGEIDHVVIDLLRADVDVMQRHAQQRRAHETLGRLGIVLEDEQETDTGLRVRWAREGSVAALAGLQQGDVLTHAGGLRLRTTADLVPAPDAPQLRLRVRPSARPSEHVVVLSLASADQSQLGHAGKVVSAVAVLVLVCLVWLAPTPRRLVWFRSERSAAEASSPNVAASTPSRSLASVVLWPLAASLFWIALAVGERWHITWHLLAIAALTGAAHLVFAQSAGPSVSRVRTLAQELGLLLIAFSPLACVGLVGGSMTIVGLVAQQGGLPWQWFVFKAPPLLVAFFVFLSGARRLIERSENRTGSIAFAIMFAGVGAAVFLGGWRPIGPGLTRLIDPIVVGIVAFAAKAWVLMLVLTLPRRNNVAVLSTSTWFGLSVASVALSLIWIRLPIAASVELVVAHALCGATFMLAVLQLWRVQRTPSLRAH